MIGRFWLGEERFVFSFGGTCTGLVLCMLDFCRSRRHAPPPITARGGSGAWRRLNTRHTSTGKDLKSYLACARPPLAQPRPTRAPPPVPLYSQEEVAGKEEAALRRLLNENEEVARQRDGIKKRLELMQRAAAEIMNFRV